LIFNHSGDNILDSPFVFSEPLLAMISSLDSASFTRGKTAFTVAQISLDQYTNTPMAHGNERMHHVVPKKQHAIAPCADKRPAFR